jgi:RNA polymerase sigma-70 factor, ECF subfamily
VEQEQILTDRIKSIFKLYKPFDRSTLLSTAARFSDFYEQTYLPVYRYLYGLTGGPQEDVEDLTAEAFTRAWRMRHNFYGDADAALGWIMKIARHLVIDDYRRRKARPEVEGEVPIKIPAASPHPEEVTLEGESQHLMWDLIKTLPDKPREMLILRYLLGWRVSQIAVYLEIPENTISVTIHRTLEQLRQQWLQQQED